MTEKPFKSSRFLLWDRPLGYPKFDLIHQDTKGPVFDLGVVLESYDGSVYLRIEDVIEMGRTLGMATIEEVANMREVIETLRAQIGRLPKAEEALRNGLDTAVNQFYRDLHSDKPDVVFGTEESEPDSSNTPEPEPSAIGTFKR